MHPDTSDPLTSRRFVLYTYVVFLVLGTLTTMLGPLLPLIAERWNIGAASAGLLFSWQFGGSVCGTLLSATQAGRRGVRAVATFGLICCAAGTISFALLPWPTLCVGVALYGTGLGICIPVMNLAIASAALPSAAHNNAQDNVETKVRRVSLLNACWTIGAIAGPLLLKGIVNIRAFLFLLVAECCALAVAGLFTSSPAAPAASVVPKAGGRVSLAIAFALLFYLYVGTENVVSGWISFYSIPVFHNEYTAMTSAAVFWAAFLCGRLLATAYFRESQGYRVVLVSALFAIVGALLILFFAGVVPLLLGTVFAGLGMAAIYPILITEMARAVGAQTPAATACFAFSGLGAATLPYFSGRISEESGRLRGGLALACVTLILLVAVFSALTPTRRQAGA